MNNREVRAILRDELWRVVIPLLICSLVLNLFFAAAVFAETPYEYALRRSCELVRAMPASLHVYDKRRIRGDLFMELYRERRNIVPPADLRDRIPRCKL